MNRESPASQRTPYGRPAFLLGLRAFDALYDLCDVPIRTEGGWVTSDLRALQGWFNIEEKAALVRDDPEADAEHTEHIDGMLFRYRVTLPFDEAERHWLYDAYDAAWGPDSVNILCRQEAEIVSSGLRRTVPGYALIRRWWSWRRECDEFEGQGTLRLAREALRELVETLSPDLGLPETYVSGEVSGQR
jgi:hypothetical protein